jgi:hypothetical protein
LRAMSDETRSYGSVNTPSGASLYRHNRQNQRRGMLRVHAVRGTHRLSGRCALFPGVKVSVETWEVAAANLKPQPVSFAEDVARRPQIQYEPVSLSGFVNAGCS